MTKVNTSFHTELSTSTYQNLPPRGTHFTNRVETRTSIKKITNGESVRTPLENVHGKGPLLLSNIPPDCKPSSKRVKINMGIDEAGRGPVLGPMVYAAAYWNTSSNTSSEYSKDDVRTKFKDSKQLNADVRSNLFQAILDSENIGFSIRILHASEISRNMLRNPPINLNTMSHNAVFEMIQAVLDLNVELETVYVDTVGIPEHYRRKLEQTFPHSGIRFVVEKKADDKYATCSAASVLAKVMRDKLMENWTFSEPFLNNGKNHIHDLNFGSGYPSDPKCKAWMERNLQDFVFGYPDIVRFSWGPAKLTMTENADTVEWPDEGDDEEENDGYQQSSMTAFFTNKKDSKKRKRLEYVERMDLTSVCEIVDPR